MAPNRKGVIDAVLAQFAGQITAPSDLIDEIGRRLLPHCIATMPPEDGENWGVLEKRTSNPYSVPYDILVWKPTLEHIDMLTSSEVSPGVRKLRSTWGNVGKLPKSTWHWCDWRATQTPIVPLGDLTPVPDPGPIEPFPGTPAFTLYERVAALEAKLDRLKAAL